jgi:hypothetical protein
MLHFADTVDPIGQHLKSSNCEPGRRNDDFELWELCRPNSVTCKDETKPESKRRKKQMAKIMEKLEKAHVAVVIDTFKGGTWRQDCRTCD